MNRLMSLWGRCLAAVVAAVFWASLWPAATGGENGPTSAPEGSSAGRKLPAERGDGSAKTTAAAQTGIDWDRARQLYQCDERSEPLSAEERAYNFWDSPRGNVSQDGRFYMFTSNWEESVGKDRQDRYREDVFIVKLPEGGQQRGPSRREPGTPPPTDADVKYGPYARNLMDVWRAKSDSATPVLVWIHAGGFLEGSKDFDARLLDECLKLGISCAGISYRFSSEAIAPAPLLDCARAIQFLRFKAKDWNLDPTRIAATGGSAGGGASLWVAFHRDLADPHNADPVLRQSSRLTCVAVREAQCSYDPRFIRDLFPGTDTYKHAAVAKLFDVDMNQLDHLPKEKYELFEEASAIHHLGKNAPPVLLMYSSTMDTKITGQGVGIHHPRFGKVLKDRMDALGIECQLKTGLQPGSEDWRALLLSFLKRHFQ